MHWLVPNATHVFTEHSGHYSIFKRHTKTTAIYESLTDSNFLFTPTPSQSPARTSGCTGLNNGLFEENSQEILSFSQDRRSYCMGARTGGVQGIKWRTVLLQDGNVHASLRCAKFHQRYQSPGEVQSSQLSWQHGILSTSSPWVKRQGFC